MNKEQLANISIRLNEQKQKRNELKDEVDALNDAMQATIRDYALGDAEQDDIAKAKQIIKEKKDEIAELDSFIQQLEIVQGDAKKEHIPVMKRIYNKRSTELQNEVNAQIQRIHEVRKEFAKELNKLGHITAKYNRINSDFEAQLQDAGVDTVRKKYRNAVRVPVTIPAGWTSAEDALGLSEKWQKSIAQGGQLPDWLRE